jgi:hypothetical protein
MGFLSRFLGFGTKFMATCPKCKELREWGTCRNCGSLRHEKKPYGEFVCRDCAIRSTYWLCSCGCEINTDFFFPTES